MDMLDVHKVYVRVYRPPTGLSATLRTDTWTGNPGRSSSTRLWSPTSRQFLTGGKIVGESEDYDSAPKAEDVVHEEFDRHPSRRQQRVSGQIPFGQVRHRFQ
jgi:hypothetical protein